MMSSKDADKTQNLTAVQKPFQRSSVQRRDLSAPEELPLPGEDSLAAWRGVEQSPSLHTVTRTAASLHAAPS